MGHLEQATALLTEAKRLFEESEQWHPAARVEAGMGEILSRKGISTSPSRRRDARTVRSPETSRTRPSRS